MVVLFYGRCNLKNYIQTLEDMYLNKLDLSSLYEIDNLNRDSEITLTCLTHKIPITKSVRTFIRGYGCKACDNLESYLTELKEKLGADFDKVEIPTTFYKEFKSKQSIVTLHCIKHGPITKSANSFLNLFCAECDKELKEPRVLSNRKSLDWFKNRIEELEPNWYSFELSDYQGTTKDITITCPVHGPFTKNAGSMLAGYLCNKCSLLKESNNKVGPKISFEEFKSQVEVVSPNIFDWSTSSEWYGKNYPFSVHCKKHGEVVKTKAIAFMYHGCPSCNLITSKVEKEILSYIKSLIPDIEVLENYRPSWLNNKELDIYIPLYNLAIEYNGTAYHHSSTNPKDKFLNNTYKPKDYHFNKWKLCKENGIRLISIYDFKWKDKQELYKSLIKHSLQLDKKVYARNCYIEEANDLQSCISFIKENHLEGFNGILYKDSKGYYLKDKSSHEVLMVALVGYIYEQSSKNFKLKLQRICTVKGITVVGGVSKLSKRITNDLGAFLYQTTNDTGSIISGISTKESCRYYWVDPKSLTYFSRNYCQKSVLEKHFHQPLLENDIENTYMERLGFVKVYDSGLTELVKTFRS